MKEYSKEIINEPISADNQEIYFPLVLTNKSTLFLDNKNIFIFISECQEEYLKFIQIVSSNFIKLISAESKVTMKQIITGEVIKPEFIGFIEFLIEGVGYK